MSIGHFHIVAKLYSVVCVASNKWLHEWLPSDLWPQTTKRHNQIGIFLLSLQSTSNLWCYFVFACLCWCCSLYRDSQQVRGPSAWSPSWTWWTTGRTRRKSWRTSCSHWGGVSARALSPAHRSPLVVAGQLYTCAHAHICQPLKGKQGKRWKDKGEGGC